MITSDEWQSKAQFNLRSFGENKNGNRAENKPCLQKQKNQVYICLHCIFIPPANVLPCKTMPECYQLVITHLMSANAMVPNNLCQ